MHSQSHLRNYQFMLMEELTEEDLRAAMFNGAFTSVMNPEEVVKKILPFHL